MKELQESYDLSTSMWPHKPTGTLGNALMKVKDLTDAKTRKGTVYKVTCAECPAIYFGETGRTIDCCIKERKRSTEKQDASIRIAVHHMETRHNKVWDTCGNSGVASGPACPAQQDKKNSIK